MKKLKLGIIGLGGISLTHIEEYLKNPRVEIVAVCDADEVWLKWKAAQLNVADYYTDYNELLKNDKVEAAIICLPNDLHCVAACAALEAGKDVLCEKPMAINAEQACIMRDTAEKTGKKLMISQNQRFGQDIQMMRSQYKEGFFGEVYFVRLAWRRPLGSMPEDLAVRENGVEYSRNWFNEKDRGGGVLRDLGSHLLDLTMYIMDFPKFVSADASCFRKFFPANYDGSYTCDSEDLATAHLKFENGLTVQLEVSFGSMVENEVLLTEMYGTKGGASRRDKLKFIKNINGAGTVDTVTRYDNKYKSVQTRFVDAVLDNTEVPVPADQGVAVIEILDAIYESAENK